MTTLRTPHLSASRYLLLTVLFAAHHLAAPALDDVTDNVMDDVTDNVMDDVTELRVGVMLVSDERVPYSVQRAAPAVDLALEDVNRDLLNGSYRLTALLRVYDNICDARFATGVAAALFYQENIIAFVGPACAYALQGVGRMAGYWNIPIVTGLGDGGEFKNKTEYPTLTRFAYCQCRLRSVFASVFQHFGWQDVVIIYDVDDSYSDVLGETLKAGLRKNGYYPHTVQVFSRSQDGIDYEGVLIDASHDARGDTLRDFLLAAHALGYPQSGQYVFLDVELFHFPGRYWGDHGWQRGDQHDPRARQAFDALLRVALFHAYSSHAWVTFAQQVRQRAADRNNFTYGTEQVNFFVGAFYDAVIHYGMALNQTLTLGQDVRDGYTVSRRMWNRTLEGVTGDVIIDDNGDRDTDFAILDMDMTTGVFEIVAHYWGARPGYNPVPGRAIHWPGPLGVPPPNRPLCGFTSEDPVCHEQEIIPTYVILLIAAVCILILVVVIFFFGYRRYIWEKDLRNTSWRVSYADISFKSARADSFKVSMTEMDTMSTFDTHESAQGYTTLGVYQGNRVALKKIREHTVALTRKVLLEIKSLRDLQHDNLTRLMGICLEQGHNYVLLQYCAKGSLQDVLLNDSIKLDWTFRLSLINDIVKAMKFLHRTDIGCHGRLSSTNCVVDSRFSLKVTDFGLPSFRHYDVVSPTDDNSHALLEKLLWVAPEHVIKCGDGYLQSGGSQKGDVYSFGIMLEEMILRSLPYDTQRGLLSVQDILDKVIKRLSPPHRPAVPKREAPPALFQLMECCWDDVVDARPSFDVIMKLTKELSQGRDVNLMDTLLTRLEEYASNLEDVVEERTRQLIEEKKNSEVLLYQILPKSVADQLKKGEAVTPESYDMVTIYFSDIVGFTAMSASSLPMEVITFLNDLYSLFDSVIELHDVYKVETIGDAYMVVSGLPERNGDLHAAHVCRMALELLERVQTFAVRHRPGMKLLLRVGIHSGPCCAGVVGKKMPRYCLFGDTVNTASRMESNGQPLKIHLNPSTKVILDRIGGFVTELRGEIEMKGKGLLTTYWLLGEKDVRTSDKSDTHKVRSPELHGDEGYYGSEGFPDNDNGHVTANVQRAEGPVTLQGDAAACGNHGSHKSIDDVEPSHHDNRDVARNEITLNISTFKQRTVDRVIHVKPIPDSMV